MFVLLRIYNKTKIFIGKYMNNILAANILMYHLPEIKDGAYKTATEIAIETLLFEAKSEWEKYYSSEIDLMDYLDISKEKYEYWFLGKR